jgi:hypothetical protein
MARDIIGCMGRRRRIPASVETDVLTASRRRCCVCFFLLDRDTVQKGQLAHLDGNPANSKFTNLAWLCLDHHDDYDSRTSQSKGLTAREVRSYRDRLYAKFRSPVSALTETVANSVDAQLGNDVGDNPEVSPPRRPWRYPLWLVANEPSYFAYTSPNRADGICLLERINLPDGRIVLAMIQTAGNPGMSISNAVEAICAQICERFELQAESVIWLQHYDDDTYDPLDWQLVTFDQFPRNGAFRNPVWTPVNAAIWQDLRLRPRRKLIKRYGHFKSLLRKMFPWPNDAL